MQVIDVLSNHARCFAGSNEFGDGEVTGIRTRAYPTILIAEATTPCFSTCFFGADEVLEINRLHARPHAARTAKVWNAGLSADPRASEEDCVLACTEQLPKGIDAGAIVVRGGGGIVHEREVRHRCVAVPHSIAIDQVLKTRELSPRRLSP